MDYVFTTDGCSGGMTWLWNVLLNKDPPWESCCVRHDYAYWRGGTKKQRAAADRKLMANVALRGHPVWAFAIWIGVRIGGVPWLPTPWRWGYGWRFGHGYKRGRR